MNSSTKNDQNTLSNAEIKQLRGIGHHLNPIVTVAANGLTETVHQELERAIHVHELIKVKINIHDRDYRQQTIEAICQQHNAILVQSIGKTALVLRRNKKPNPRLSNLLRMT